MEDTGRRMYAESASDPTVCLGPENTFDCVCVRIPDYFPCRHGMIEERVLDSC